jgi:radical SAM superfamily enzyme YgiQ (UPF0313 family)
MGIIGAWRGINSVRMGIIGAWRGINSVRMGIIGALRGINSVRMGIIGALRGINSVRMGIIGALRGINLDKNNDIIIDTLPLDYSILEEIDYKPTTDAYYGYMTRGCPNRCNFCAVPSKLRVTMDWKFKENTNDHDYQ